MRFVFRSFDENMTTNKVLSKTECVFNNLYNIHTSVYYTLLEFMVATTMTDSDFTFHDGLGMDVWICMYPLVH